MRILVLGRGKTGSLVAEVAHEHGHSVRALDDRENHDGAALTPPLLTQFDVVVDFTTPQAVVANVRACLAAGAKVVVGTTGWYAQLDEVRSYVERRNGALLYGTNFSVGMQRFYQLAAEFGRLFAKDAHYTLSLHETHHAEKKDAPSGTALTLQKMLAEAGGHAEISSERSGDAAGLHTLEAKSATDRIVLTHEAFSRRGFAEGAIRAAEWLGTRTGCYDFRDVFEQME